MDNKTFTDNLRRLRLEKGFTQEQLAEQLGVSAQSVSRWECGTTLPDVTLLPAIARVYGVTIDDLYREDPCAYPNLAARLLAVYEASGRSEDFLAAEQEFVRLMAGEHTPDDLRGFGVLYHYMMKHCAARAQDCLEAAIRAAGEGDWVRSSAAQQRLALLCDLGRGAQEAQRCDRELAEDRTDPRRWVLCVAAHRYAGENERALELAEEALSRFPENAILHIYAGDICRERKAYDEAFAHWRRAKELDREAMDPDYSMGFCYEELGEYEKAYQVWQALRQELLARGLTQETQLPEERMKLCGKKMGRSPN